MKNYIFVIAKQRPDIRKSKRAIRKIFKTAVFRFYPSVRGL
jgi:hypothetical protein